MQLIITGIHGFVGSNLVNNLCDYHSLNGLDIVFPKHKHIKQTYTWLDLEKLPPTNTIIHLAGNTD
jgi:nucleoside-diphosphate-sugar epimerase